jgi:hypothetical protein
MKLTPLTPYLYGIRNLQLSSIALIRWRCVDCGGKKVMEVQYDSFSCAERHANALLAAIICVFALTDAMLL